MSLYLSANVAWRGARRIEKRGKEKGRKRRGMGKEGMRALSVSTLPLIYAGVLRHMRKKKKRRRKRRGAKQKERHRVCLCLSHALHTPQFHHVEFRRHRWQWPSH